MFTQNYTSRPHAFSSIERIRTGAKAIIVHEEKILLIRERVSRPGREEIIHDFPGGGIELGETLTDALKREVFEEVGLHIEPIRVAGAWDYLIPKWDLSDIDKTNANVATSNPGIHIICIGYECKVVGEPIIDTAHNPAAEDIFETRWVTREELLADERMNTNHEVVAAIKNLTSL